MGVSSIAYLYGGKIYFSVPSTKKKKHSPLKQCRGKKKKERKMPIQYFPFHPLSLSSHSIIEKVGVGEAHEARGRQKIAQISR